MNPVQAPRMLRDPAPLLAQVQQQWAARGGALWVFGYASLIWRPDFEVAERRPARVHGWHRALKMWSHVNRGTPEVPGLVFALLGGGSCCGMALRVPSSQASEVLAQLWQREMVTGVYDPRWLPCHTPNGQVQALAFTLSRRSPSYSGRLSPAQIRQIFASARGRFGSTHDYAVQTYHSLRRQGIHDRELEALLSWVSADLPDAPSAL